MAWVEDRKTSWRLGRRVDGKVYKVTVSKKEYPKKKDAQRKANELEAEGVGLLDKNISYSAYTESFIANKTLTEGSRQRYFEVKGYFEKFLIDRHPNLPLCRTKAEIAQEFVKWMQEQKTSRGKDFSNNGINYVIRCQRELFNDAFQNRIIKDNPFRKGNVNYLPKTKIQIRIPPKEEVERVLYWLKENMFQYFTYVYLLSRFGSRRGEIRTLKINDVEFEGERIYIYKHKVKEEGVRKLTETDCLVLNEHILYLKRHKLYSPFGWLFPSKVKDKDRCLRGVPIGKDTIRKILKKATMNLGITRHYYPKIFRHYFVTSLKDKGYSSENIAKLSGHKDARTIDEHYTHSTDRVVEQMDKEMEIDVEF